MTRRRDGWQNVLTKLGTDGDKRMSTDWIRTHLSESKCRELWRGNDLAARVIEEPPAEAMREGFTLKIEANKELADEILTRYSDVNGECALVEAMEFERAMGGGAIMPVVNDGSEDLSQPLGKYDIVERLQVLEPRELRPERWYDSDIRHEKFGRPEVYRLEPRTPAGSRRSSAMLIHESRLIVFPGRRVTRDQTGTVYGWGDSVLDRFFDSLRDYENGIGSAAALLPDFAQGVMNIDGLAEMISSADGDTDVATRFQVIEQVRSALRMMVLDGKDSFKRESTPLDGLADVLDRIERRLAAAADMPLTRLFGMSPGGMNATGESDTRFWYDRIAKLQKRVKPMVDLLLRFLFNEQAGPAKGKEPTQWSSEFKPLWQPSDKEDAEAREIQQRIDSAYIADGVYSAEEVAINRFGGDSYSFQTSIDFEARAALEPDPREPVQQDPSEDDPARADRRDRIEKRGEQWVVLSMEGEVLGTHETEEQARAQLGAVEASKKSGAY